MMTGRCFWEKTTNGCKNKEHFLKRNNAYDFYALCLEGEQKEAEYQCKGKPAALKAGQCDARVKKTDSEYCQDCEKGAWF